MADPTDRAAAESPAGHTPGAAGADEAALSPEELAELVSLARAGELEIPAGADGLAAAVLALADERDALNDRLVRTAADYQNFQRRAANNEVEARRQGVTGVVQSVLTVLDHFDLALSQDPAKVGAEQIIGGVRVIKGELLRVLTGHGVGPIEPARGDDFDPNRHEAVMQASDPDLAPGLVVRTLSTGYTLGDRVARPARVSVSAGPETDADAAPPRTPAERDQGDTPDADV